MSPLASTRWCPTPEQLMILELMYRGGIKTPNASQIQQITAHLSHYGKIEGKNVFYWFQNHKARDRQKLRRKLISKQQQLHHQHLHHFEASGSTGLQHFPHFSNSTSLLPQDQGPQETTTQVLMNDKTSKVDSSQIEEMEKWVRLRGCEYWMNNMSTSATTHSCCSRPLRTLELFPVKSTYSLKAECTTSKTLSCTSQPPTN